MFTFQHPPRCIPVVRNFPTLHQTADMKPFLTLSIALFASIALSAQSVTWAKRFGANPFDRGYAIAADAAGNSYVTGYFRNTVAFGSTSLTSAGGDDVFVAKLAPDGEVIWATRAGGTGSLDKGFAIATDGQGNCFVTGHFLGTATFGSTTLTAVGNVDVFIAKLDISGAFVWARGTGGDTGDTGQGVAADAFGNCYVTGAFSGTVAFGASTLQSPSGNVFITKLGPDGEFLWARQAGGPDLDKGCALALDAAGNCFITGQIGSDFTAPGYTATFGGSVITTVGEGDVFVTKLDPDGAFLWTEHAGGAADDMGTGISIDASGNCYITGYFEGMATFGATNLTAASSAESDVFVAKLDPTGAWQWASRAGGTGNDGGTGIATDASGRSFVAGTFGGAAIFGTTELSVASDGAVFIAEVAADGTFLSAQRVGGSINERQNGAIALDPAGFAHVTGWFRGEAPFGGTTLTAAGNNDDIFVLKLAGGPVSVREWGGASNVLAYPNPTSAMLRIQIEEQVLAVDIHNASGALVRTETGASFSVEQLPVGLYLLRIRTTNGWITTRVMKE